MSAQAGVDHSTRAAAPAQTRLSTHLYPPESCLCCPSLDLAVGPPPPAIATAVNCDLPRGSVPSSCPEPLSLGRVRKKLHCHLAVAYVKFDKASSAALAMEALNGAVLNNGRGPKLKVLLAEEPTQRCGPRNFAGAVV